MDELEKLRRENAKLKRELEEAKKNLKQAIKEGCDCDVMNGYGCRIHRLELLLG